MFRKRTVFVVGAGASKELGMPTGGELSGLISTLCNAETNDWGAPRGRPLVDMLDALEPGARNDPAKTKRWIAVLQDIRAALPYKDSIDAVIDQYHDRPEIAAAGKYMIARFIMEAEAKSHLKPSQTGFDAPDLARSRESWLHTFSRMLFESLRRDDLKNIGNNVGIVCFNYDRCIERYLTYAVSETYGVEPDAAMEFVSRIPLIHVYGSLGALPGWPLARPQNGSVPFGGTGRNPVEVARYLKTFSETVDSDIDEAIGSIMRAADQYVYLGLSFGRQNMALLGNGTKENIDERPTFASGLGQFEQGRSSIVQLLRSTYTTRDFIFQGNGETYLELDTSAKRLLDLHWHNILG